MVVVVVYGIIVIMIKIMRMVTLIGIIRLNWNDEGTSIYNEMMATRRRENRAGRLQSLSQNCTA